MKNRKIKKISRRKFSSGLAATGVATSTLMMPGNADANQEGGAAELVGALVGLLLIGGGRNAIPMRKIIFLFAAAAIVLSVSPRQKLVPVRKLPNSQRPNALSAVTRAVATAYVFNTALYIVMNGGLPAFRNLNLVTFPTGPNGEQLSAQKNFRPKPRKVKNLPSQAQVKSQGQRVGVLRAGAKSRNLYLDIKGLRAKF